MAEPANKRQRLSYGSSECKTNRNSDGGATTQHLDDDKSLMVIGEDCLSFILSFLSPRDLCKSELVCKTLKSSAATFIDNLILKMNKDCDRVPDGEGTRTKLIRYVAAIEMAQTVRDGLSDHLPPRDIRALANFPVHVPHIKAACKGCKKFPRTLNHDLFSPTTSDSFDQYEFFYYIYDDDDEIPIKYQGFLQPNIGVDSMFSSELSLHSNLPNWPKMRTLLQSEVETHDDAYWETLCNEVLSTGLSVVIIAVNKNNNAASLCGACQDYTDDEVWCSFRFSKFQLKCDIHPTRNVKEANFAHTCITFQVNRGRALEIGANFWGDEKYDGHQV